ncbi:MAG: hypothetical protein ACLFRU_01215 [Paracoccaceae bacterium]
MEMRNWRFDLRVESAELRRDLILVAMRFGQTPVPCVLEHRLCQRKELAHRLETLQESSKAAFDLVARNRSALTLAVIPEHETAQREVLADILACRSFRLPIRFHAWAESRPIAWDPPYP